jgi:hypothetical protein
VRNAKEMVDSEIRREGEACSAVQTQVNTKGGRRRRTFLVVATAWAKKITLGPVNKNDRYELKVDFKEEPSNRE